MASEIIVNTIKAPTTGANANKVIIPSGVTLDASGGNFSPPSGHIIQTSAVTRVNNLQMTINNSSVNTAVGNGVIASITPKQSNSLFRVVLSYGANGPSGQYVATRIFTSVAGGSYTNVGSHLPIAWTGGSGSWDTSMIDQILDPTYTLGDTISFQPYIYTFHSSTTAYWGWGTSGGGSQIQFYVQEIAQ